MYQFIIGMLLVVAQASGQFASQQPGFEVASVKLVQESRTQMYSFASSGPRVRYVAYATINLLMEAYDVKEYQVTFAPTAAPLAGGVYGTAYFDIEAKAEGNQARTRAEFRSMLQTLLADRFRLRVHSEMKEIPGYALLIGKGGPRFKESPPDATESAHIGFKDRNSSVTASRTRMDELASLIQSVFSLDRPVVDRTGLTGAYDFKIQATPESQMAANDSELRNIGIFTAVQQQLGLKLAPQKLMLEVLVVDHVEQPSPN